MFVARVLDDPDRTRGVLACSVGQQLSKVIVVGVLDLVLDDDSLLRARHLGENVQIVPSNGRLRLNRLDLKTYRLTKKLDAIRRRQPLGEVTLLVFPDLAKFNSLKFSKLHLRHSPYCVRLFCVSVPTYVQYHGAGRSVSSSGGTSSSS